jgi:hypothetical protein
VTRRGLSMTDASGQFNAVVRRAGVRVCNRCVRSLAEPERPVTHPEDSACLSADRTRWRIVRSKWLEGRVNSLIKTSTRIT